MVLSARRRRRQSRRTGLAVLLLVSSQGALAQSVGTTAPAVYPDDPEFRLDPTIVGPLAVSTGFESSLTYDSNIFATPNNEVDDFVLEASPSVSAVYANPEGGLTLGLFSEVRLRRYFDNDTENSDAATIRSDATWRMSQEDRLALTASWSRAIEDRGDPEARNRSGIGPRRYDILALEGGYSRRGPKFTMAVDAEVRKTDALAAIDDRRDFTAYAASLTGGVRVGPGIYGTVTGYANERDFRIERGTQGNLRDTSTYGARAGLSFDPGGLVEGDIALGAFWLEPEDPDVENRTGFSASGLVTYRPRQRTALTLDMFSGDVASFRQGASTRTDTQVLVGVQQEVRHNFYASGRLGWRSTDYLGSDVREDTVAADVEVEYLVSRNFSVAGTASYGTRDSDIPGDEFDRFRTGAELRLQF